MAEGTGTQTGDPGRTPGTAEGDRETVEQDLQEKQTEKKGMEQDKNPPQEGIDVNQHSSGDRREHTGHVIDQQDEWIHKHI